MSTYLVFHESLDLAASTLLASYTLLSIASYFHAADRLLLLPFAFPHPEPISSTFTTTSFKNNI